MTKNVIAVIDGEAGSCGKAKVIGEIALDPTIKIGAAVTNCMPNAGHTFVDEKGEKTIFRNIPVSSVNKDAELFIGPGSAIDMNIFQEEYEKVQKYVGDRKIYIHEMVPLIEERHKEYEREHIKSGSTFKGCGAVTQEKVIREKQLQFMKSFKNAIVLKNEEWLEKLYHHLEREKEYVILEGAQGCDLDINHSGNYPFTTSRNVSTTQLLADSGISAEHLLETIMVIRPFPIRISNITKKGEIIYTGGYGMGEELTWTQVNLSSMYGTYPYQGDVECYPHTLNRKRIKKGLKYCPEIYLKQIFGENYKQVKPEEVTLLEALELERLFYKSKGSNCYQTKYLDLPLYQSDLEKSTIFDQSEQTTVTKMERRIFDIDIEKLRRNCMINTPYALYLNFFQHLDRTFQGKKGNFDEYYFNKYLREYFAWLEEKTKTEIMCLGTGEKNGEKILKKSLIKN